MSISRFFKSTVAEKVIHFTPIAHARKGFEDFFRGIYLWDGATQIQHVLLQSLYSNTVEYLLPVILYRRLVTAILENYSPDEIDPYIQVLDFTILLTIFSRLYLRRLADNTFNTISLSRAISVDVATHLVDLAAENYAESIATMLPKLFTPDITIPPEALKAAIKIQLQSTFKKFFAKKNLFAEMFAHLVNPLKEVISSITLDYFIYTPDASIINNYATLLAKIITNEIASLYAPEYKNYLAVYESALETSLSVVMMPTVAKNKVSAFTHDIKKATDSLKLFLPIPHPSICNCNMTKLLHAEISSPIYYAGNHFYISLPSIAYAWGYLPDTIYQRIQLPLALLSILTYGQSFNEYKITTSSTCTRHRYKEFAKNKAHSFGVGLAFYLTWQALIQIVYLTTNVDNFLTRDALINLVMQLGMVSMLAYNEYLPGKKEFPWDYFLLSRTLTLGLVNVFKWLVARDPDDTKATDSMLVTVQSALMSERFSQGVYVIFSGSNFLPQTLIPQNEDPRRILATVPSFKFMIKSYRKDLEYLIQKAKQIYTWTTWLANPLLYLPTPGMLSIFVEVLQLMKNEDWVNLIKQNELELFLTFFPDDIEVGEQMVKTFPSTKTDNPRFLPTTIIDDYQGKPLHTKPVKPRNIITMNFKKSSVTEPGILTARDAKASLLSAVNERMDHFAAPSPPSSPTYVSIKRVRPTTSTSLSSLTNLTLWGFSAAKELLVAPAATPSAPSKELKALR